LAASEASASWGIPSGCPRSSKVCRRSWQKNWKNLFVASLFWLSSLIRLSYRQNPAWLGA